MRLSIEKRLRIVTIYEKHQLWSVSGKYRILKALLEQEDIKISRQSLSKLIMKWKHTGKEKN